MMPRSRRWGWFWGTPIQARSGHLFRFYGLTIGRVGLGVVTHPRSDGVQ